MWVYFNELLRLLNVSVVYCNEYIDLILTLALQYWNHSKDIFHVVHPSRQRHFITVLKALRYRVSHFLGNGFFARGGVHELLATGVVQQWLAIALQELAHWSHSCGQFTDSLKLFLRVLLVGSELISLAVVFFGLEEEVSHHTSSDSDQPVLETVSRKNLHLLMSGGHAQFASFSSPRNQDASSCN